MQPQQRLGIGTALRSLLPAVLFYGAAASLILVVMWPYFYYVKNEAVIVIGVFAGWRYGWQVLNICRALWYRRLVYPGFLARIAALDESQRYPEHIFFLIPSYGEAPWVTEECLRALFTCLAQIPSRATLVMATGSDREDQVIGACYRASPVRDKVDLVLQRQSQGKRIAMGHAARAIARRYDGDPNSVTVFMDGDTRVDANVLARVLPFFRIHPRLGALTTDEVAHINTGSMIYRDWFNLKFGQRHLLFQSQSLSRRVLTLTGRFSAYRTSIVVEEAFVRRVERDAVSHWMHGTFRFLMGDDKSSWFHLLQSGWEMLYVPDVVVYSMESRDAPFLSLSRDLSYRWYGNTMRTNSRALGLGVRRIGLYTWYAILDQRLSVWTALVGITGAIILTLTKSFIYLPFYLAWVTVVRLIQLTAIALSGHPVGFMALPLTLYNQWIGSIIKIRAAHFLADQKWTKGARTQDTAHHVPVPHWLARVFPTYLMALSCAAFLIVMLIAEGALTLPEPDLAIRDGRVARYKAAHHGVIADDGRDDALALQELIDRSAKDGRPVRIELPAGTIDLHHQVVIRQGPLDLVGEGPTTHLRSTIAGDDLAVLSVSGRRTARLGTLDTALRPDDHQLTIRFEQGGVAKPGDLLWLAMPNDDAFFKQIDSRTWRKTQPALRQTLVRVTRVDGARVVIEHPTGLDLEPATTVIYAVAPAQTVRLADFVLEQTVAGATGPSAAFTNAYPSYRVDGIALDWTDAAVIERVRVLNAGRHPISVEQSYAFSILACDLEGAWNKGEGGNGYLRIARSHRGFVRGGSVQGLRHITLQWSSSFNRLEGIRAAVDVNFHGGYAHHNRVENITFAIPAEHRWPAIVRTPVDAEWAPPDGPDNLAVSP